MREVLQPRDPVPQRRPSSSKRSEGSDVGFRRKVCLGPFKVLEFNVATPKHNQKQPKEGMLQTARPKEVLLN